MDFGKGEWDNKKKDKPFSPSAPGGGTSQPAGGSSDESSENTEDLDIKLKQATLKSLLTEMIDLKASDLHLTVGIPPTIRTDGSLEPMNYGRLSAEKVQSLAYSVLTDKQKKEYEQNNELDLSFGITGLSRFRANVFKQRGTVAMAIRTIPYEILAFDVLGLPKIVEEMVRLPKGLILVTGPTGSGKSTTLASIIDKINKSRHSHIITIEDPIEYVHRHQNCIINQREINTDTATFPIALKYVLRQDPDIILIGEMRDLETVEAAITIAETGHLVFATLHTNNALQSINRIIDIFPAHSQSQVRTQLSFILQAILSQTLIPMVNGGRCLACEVMIPTPAIRNMIREDKVHQIYSAMQTGKKYGMRTMNEHLASLVKGERASDGSYRKISKQEAMERATDKDELRDILQNKYNIIA